MLATLHITHIVEVNLPISLFYLFLREKNDFQEFSVLVDLYTTAKILKIYLILFI